MKNDIETAIIDDCPEDLKEALSNDIPAYRRNQVARQALENGAAACLDECFADWPSNKHELGDFEALEKAALNGDDRAVRHVLGNFESDTELRTYLYNNRVALRAVQDDQPAVARAVLGYTAGEDGPSPEPRFQDQLKEVQFEATSRQHHELNDWIKERLIGDLGPALRKHLKDDVEFGRRPDDMKHPLRYLEPQRLRTILDTDQLGRDFVTTAFHEYFDDIVTNPEQHRDRELRPEILDVLIQKGADPDWTIERMEKLKEVQRAIEIIDLLLTRNSLSVEEQAELMHRACRSAFGAYTETNHAILERLLDEGVRPEDSDYDRNLTDALIVDCSGEGRRKYLRTLLSHRCLPTEEAALKGLDDPEIEDVLHNQMPERKLSNLDVRKSVSD